MAKISDDKGWTIIGGGAGIEKEEYLKSLLKTGTTKGGNYVDLTISKVPITIRINTVSAYTSGIVKPNEIKAANMINEKLKLKNQNPIYLFNKGDGVLKLSELLKNYE